MSFWIKFHKYMLMLSSYLLVLIPTTCICHIVNVLLVKNNIMNDFLFFIIEKMIVFLGSLIPILFLILIIFLLLYYFSKIKNKAIFKWNLFLIIIYGLIIILTFLTNIIFENII